ncbi:hypothetical protein K493DRAFT_359644 [Basidiobolus meristosporus CBS 931.73]|uniref:Uncharacterized protein n=1 Tax=Basidiobolus meristosporus CBS 931.73 TaxID=1314790 RepID=A0A1Y1XS54_9FUNG|nr:hypothetical protein K493DRAFT_359644 [Basidiobolus meristosporus CBS 931.73]|eukprot:ORX88336.1 hypothetical protein K493DRAFT_359644 [Basidiobolus meristosporus CBS 931.73]
MVGPSEVSDLSLVKLGVDGSSCPAKERPEISGQSNCWLIVAADEAIAKTATGDSRTDEPLGDPIKLIVNRVHFAQPKRYRHAEEITRAAVRFANPTPPILLIQTTLATFFGIPTVQRFYRLFDLLFLLSVRNIGKMRGSEHSTVTHPKQHSMTTSETDVDCLLTMIWIPHQFLIYLVDVFALHFVYQEFVRGYKLVKEIGWLVRELVARSNSRASRSKPSLAIESRTEDTEEVIPTVKPEAAAEDFNGIIESTKGPIHNPLSELFVPLEKSSPPHQANHSETRKRKSSLLSRLSPKPGNSLQSSKMKKILGRLSLRGKSKNP